MSWTHQFTSGNVQLWFLGMCPGGNETVKSWHFQDIFISARTFFLWAKTCSLLSGDSLDILNRRVRIPDKEREDWMPIGRAGDELFCYQVNARKDWRVGKGNAEPNETNHGWKSCFGIGNPPIFKKEDLNTQVNVLTTAYTFLIFSLGIVKLFGGPSSSFLGWIRKKGRSETCIELMCLESMLSNEIMNTASINSWLFN